MNQAPTKDESSHFIKEIGLMNQALTKLNSFCLITVK